MWEVLQKKKTKVESNIDFCLYYVTQSKRLINWLPSTVYKAVSGLHTYLLYFIFIVKTIP